MELRNRMPILPSGSVGHSHRRQETGTNTTPDCTDCSAVHVGFEVPDKVLSPYARTGGHLFDGRVLCRPFVDLISATYSYSQSKLLHIQP